MSIYSQVPSLQPKLAEQINAIKERFSTAVIDGVLGALLYGSVNRGEATYRSDIDILVILRQSGLSFSDVQRTRDSLERAFISAEAGACLAQPLPVEFTVVAQTVFETQEPEMLKSLRDGTILLDPEGVLKINKNRLGAGA